MKDRFADLMQDHSYDDDNDQYEYIDDDDELLDEGVFEEKLSEEEQYKRWAEENLKNREKNSNQKNSGAQSVNIAPTVKSGNNNQFNQQNNNPNNGNKNKSNINLKNNSQSIHSVSSSKPQSSALSSALKDAMAKKNSNSNKNAPSNVSNNKNASKEIEEKQNDQQRNQAPDSDFDFENDIEYSYERKGFLNQIKRKSAYFFSKMGSLFLFSIALLRKCFRRNVIADDEQLANTMSQDSSVENKKTEDFSKNIDDISTKSWKRFLSPRFWFGVCKIVAKKLWTGLKKIGFCLKWGCIKLFFPFSWLYSKMISRRHQEDLSNDSEQIEESSDFSSELIDKNKNIQKNASINQNVIGDKKSTSADFSENKENDEGDFADSGRDWKKILKNTGWVTAVTTLVWATVYGSYAVYNYKTPSDSEDQVASADEIVPELTIEDQLQADANQVASLSSNNEPNLLSDKGKTLENASLDEPVSQTNSQNDEQLNLTPEFNSLANDSQLLDEMTESVPATITESPVNASNTEIAETAEANIQTPDFAQSEETSATDNSADSTAQQELMNNDSEIITDSIAETNDSNSSAIPDISAPGISDKPANESVASTSTELIDNNPQETPQPENVSVEIVDSLNDQASDIALENVNTENNVNDSSSFVTENIDSAEPIPPFPITETENITNTETTSNDLLMNPNGTNNSQEETATFQLNSNDPNSLSFTTSQTT
ncbi:MAG: hypothetical protein Q4C95_12620, partial [Planctomycetia bacterium]|nr:hypothetical protein [Planctomycetia bacterium]